MVFSGNPLAEAATNSSAKSEVIGRRKEILCKLGNVTILGAPKTSLTLTWQVAERGRQRKLSKAISRKEFKSDLIVLKNPKSRKVNCSKIFLKMEMYKTVKYTGSDYQVVPDDGYNSPDYPYYMMDSVSSPAGSTTSSSVDSAFDELAEVIPELNDSDKFFAKSPKACEDISVLNSYKSPETLSPDRFGYQLSENGLRNSPNMYEAASPAMSSSDYGEAMSPSNDLMKAVKQASTKRQLSPYEGSTVDLTYISSKADQPSKKRKMTDSEAIARYTEVLLSLDAQKKDKTRQKMFFYSDNEDSGIGMPSFDTNASSADKVNDVTQEGTEHQPLLNLDDDILANNFAVLAEYLNCDIKPMNNQKTSALEDSYVVIKRENDVKPVVMQPLKVVPQSKTPKAIGQKVSSGVKIESQVVSITQAPVVNSSQASTLKSSSNATAMSPASVVTWCKGSVPKADGVIFFQVPNNPPQISTSASQDSKMPEPVTETTKSSTVNVQDWMTKPRSRRSSLMARSNKPRLYHFLLELLHDPCYKCIEWVDEMKGIFKFIDSGEVARFWGQRKNKPNMKYENFARSLRTYIAKGILTKPRNKLVYQFTPDYL